MYMYTVHAHTYIHVHMQNTLWNTGTCTKSNHIGGLGCSCVEQCLQSNFVLSLPDCLCLSLTHTAAGRNTKRKGRRREGEGKKRQREREEGERAERWNLVLTEVTWPLWQARCKAVSPVRQEMLGSTPMLMRAVTALVLPEAAAKCSGVYPGQRRWDREHKPR